MDVKKENVRLDIVSCNFCDGGTLNESGMGLVFPYEYVFTFKRSNGGGIKASICQNCLDELIEATKNERD